MSPIILKELTYDDSYVNCGYDNNEKTINYLLREIDRLRIYKAKLHLITSCIVNADLDLLAEYPMLKKNVSLKTQNEKEIYKAGMSFIKNATTSIIRDFNPDLSPSSIYIKTKQSV